MCFSPIRQKRRLSLALCDNMELIRWIIGFGTGIAATFLFVTAFASFFYAVPRSIINRLAGFVSWKPTLQYIVTGFLFMFAWWMAGWIGMDLLAGSQRGSLVGSVFALVGTLVKMKYIRYDIDANLYRNYAASSKRHDKPAWALRVEGVPQASPPNGGVIGSHAKPLSRLSRIGQVLGTLVVLAAIPALFLPQVHWMEPSACQADRRLQAQRRHALRVRRI